jgi:cytidyltransferase-like protein
MTTTPAHAAGHQKIVPVSELPRIRQQFRDKRIVLCHGAFDLIHMGHLIHFEEAKAFGDILVVTITGDKHITKKRSVSFSETDRARQVAALEIVDYVAIIQEPSAVAAIEALHPDVYIKGSEYANLVLDKSANIFREKELVERYGGRIEFTSGQTFSSTKLSHFLLASPEASQGDPLLRNDRVVFRDISDRHFTLEQLKGFLAGASALRVCVLGETIIDEWVDVRVTNLSQKSRCVAGIERSRIRQIGGAGVVALHLADFVSEVHCYTNGLTGALPANVKVVDLNDAPLVKTRFVDADTGHKLFECKSDDVKSVAVERLPDFDQFDLVLLADFGHGLLDRALMNGKIAATKKAFVAAMAQVNSSNYGYNLPTKYRGAHFYSLNRTEAELCLQERGLPVADVAARMSTILDSTFLAVTDGERGAHITRRGETYMLPTLSTSTVDTIGCGDAFFALASVAASLGCPAGLVALAGSIGAAAVAQRRGNERPISDQEFMTIGKIVI